MFDIKFVVNTNAYYDQQLKIIGSPPSLGQWNSSSALVLQKKHDYWQSAIIQIEQNKKFQFKIIKEKYDGSTEWQYLPNNSNRKFKPQYSSKLHITWSSPEGSVSPLHKSQIGFHNKALPQKLPHQNLTNSKGKQSSLRRSKQEFDPYKKAHQQDSTDSEDQKQFFLVKRKMSDEIVMNSTDLEEIYNKNSPLEIYWDLLSKSKVYVVYGSNFDESDPFYRQLKEELSNISHKYHVKWIPEWLILQDQKQFSYVLKAKTQGSMFDIREEEISKQSLFSKSSFFIFSDVNTAIKTKEKISKTQSCLYVNTEQFSDIIESFHLLNHINLICFDDPQKNEDFSQFLIDSKQNNQQNLEFLKKCCQKQSGFVQQILQTLKLSKDKQLFKIQTHQKYAQLQALKRINSPNTMTILDGHIFESSPQFCSKIIKNINRYSMIIIITKGIPSQKLFKIGSAKNIVLVYDNFQRIRMQGSDYNPLRRCKENLELLRMKIKLYLQNHGGSINERQSSIIYNLPEGREDLSNKIYEQLAQFINRHEIGRVSLKGTRLKINWNFAIEARFLRTICEIKYLAFGPLGNFNIVSDMFNLRQLKDVLKLLVEHHQSIFLQKAETLIRYYSYGKGKTATCHILPE